MTIKAVVFDIGNVLIHWQPEAFYDRVIGVDRRKALFAAVDLHAMNAQIDLGADWRSTVYDCAEAHPDHADAIRMWHDRWLEMASPAIDHSVRLLRALRRRKVPVFALSNFGTGPFQIAEANYPFLEEFDQRFLSGALKIAKPDAAIYQAVEEATGIPPMSLLFTDDRAENIDAAQARGWQTHLFDGPKGFAARLQADGLLSQEDAV